MKTLAHYTFTLLVHLLISSLVLAQAGTGTLLGTVTDESSGEAIPFANVTLMLHGQQVSGASTDFDGKYKMSGLKPSTDYIMKVSALGFKSIEKHHVMVKSDKNNLVDLKLTVATAKLQEVVISEQRVPVIEKDGGSTITVTGSNIVRMPSRGAAAAVTRVAGVQRGRKGKGKIGSIRGTRKGSTRTYIDGVRVRGSANLSRAAIEQVQVVTGGVPAKYENAADTESKLLVPINRVVDGSIQIEKSRRKKKIEPEGLDHGYDLYKQQSFKNVFAEPLSTFSIDVDAASYSQIRRSLNMGTLPHPEIVRIEEIINYFKYDYPQPEGEEPFGITTEVSECPWNKANKLVHIGLQGEELELEERPSNNLVFLIDVSGSMSSRDKLPLLQKSLRLLVSKLEETDKISIVVYAGAAGIVLQSTRGDKQEKILAAIDRLHAGGSTAGGAGIELAYSIAEKQFIKNGNNRVLLCTDGDFNVGVSSADGLEKLIEKKRESGVFLTVLGFGTGNFQDHKMETLADKGNGNFAYIDNLQEAQKVLVQEFWGTIFTIAKDVKIQVEFNPANVLAYRLIGYENRRLAAEDFNDDRKDAGELGAGHTVTALYEVIPVGGELPNERPSVDSLKYQLTKPTLATGLDGELLTVKLRYKQPDGDVSKLLSVPVSTEAVALDSSSVNMQFSAALSLFGMTLMDQDLKVSQRMGQLQKVIKLAKEGKGQDKDGRRAEFIRLAELAMAMR